MSEVENLQFENLIDELVSSDDEVKSAARKKSQILDEPRFFDSWVNLLNHPDPSKRLLAATHLANLAYTRAYEVLLNLAEKDNKKSAVIQLGEIKYLPALEPFISMLLDKNRPNWIRAECALALGKIGNEKALEPLKQVLMDETEIRSDYDAIAVRDSAALALTNFNEEALTILLTCLKTTDSWGKYYIALALGKMNDTIVVPEIIPLLKDEDHFYLRSAAARVLGQLGDVRAIDYLYEALLSEKDSYVHEIICLALGELGDSRVVQQLITIMWHPRLDKRNSVKAAKLLGQFKGESIFEQLIKGLESPFGVIRVGAAEGLAQFGDKKALPAMELALQNSTNVRGFNTKAVEAINKAIEQLQQY